MDSEFKIEIGDTDSFNLNKSVAYKGKIGREREEFCVNYIKNKKAVFERIRQEIADLVENKDFSFTCHRGCSNCCVLYIEADIQECEAIVYYLYHNDDILSIFLNQYPGWRQKTGSYGDLLIKHRQALLNMRQGEFATGNQVEDWVDSLLDYQWLNVPCPLLYDSACSIYEVRPFVCATHYVTSPAEWCSPVNPYPADVYRTSARGEQSDLSFYHKQLSQPVSSSMPLLVYQILESGFSYLSGVTGLNSLEEEAMNDPEVRALLSENGRLINQP